MLQHRIVFRDRESQLITGERLGKRTALTMNVGQAANRGEIFRRALEDDFELALRFIKRPRSASARPSVTRADR